MVDFNLGDYIPNLDSLFSYFLSDPLATRGIIIALRNSRKIPFDLELISDELTEGELESFADELRHRVSRHYPNLKLSEDLVLSGKYGGANRGPAVQGETDIETFRETFGEGVQLGVSCLFGRFRPPVELRPQWYQVGRLHVPKKLRDLVRGVYLTKQDNYRELKLWIPAEAQKYPTVNELR